MNQNSDLFDEIPNTHGGRREGAGRKPGYSPKEQAKVENGELDLDDPNISEATRTAVKKARAVASKEEALAQHAWLKLRVDSGEYMPRTAYREATATLLAELAQGLRSLPDEIERKHPLPPEVLTLIEHTIDDRLNAIAEGLSMYTGVAETVEQNDDQSV